MSLSGLRVLLWGEQKREKKRTSTKILKCTWADVVRLSWVKRTSDNRDYNSAQRIKIKDRKFSLGWEKRPAVKIKMPPRGTERIHMREKKRNIVWSCLETEFVHTKRVIKKTYWPVERSPHEKIKGKTINTQLQCGRVLIPPVLTVCLYVEAKEKMDALFLYECTVETLTSL